MRRLFSVLAIIVLTTESSYAAQRGPGGGTPVPPSARTAVVKPAPATVKPAPATVKPAPATAVKKTSSKPAKPAALSPVQRKLQRNPGLAAKISGRLPAGTNLMTAASGFRTVAQFVSAVNGSNTTRIPFAELKRRMAYDGMTLSQAIQDVRPTVRLPIAGGARGDRGRRARRHRRSRRAGDDVRARPALIAGRARRPRRVARQNNSFTATCTCRGSPTPARRNPSKLKSAGVLNGLTLLALLNVLNISTIGMSW